MDKPIPKINEKSFTIQEMFFSRTDSKGLILSGNDVFVRVSGYTRQELLHAPHNIIRHPDMPKCVFRLFWETLKAGRPIAAYVKNLAHDGSYYWVMAIAIPLSDGYLSVRIKPSTGFFAKVLKIYPHVLAAEKAGGIDKGSEALMAALAEAGFATYSAFMTEALCAEQLARDEVLSRETREQSGGKGAHDPIDAIKSKIGDAAAVGASTYQRIFQRLQFFREASEIFKEETSGLLKEFQDLRHLSVNMTISAAKFGHEADTLSVVSNRFQGLADEIERHLLGFMQASEEIRKSLGSSTLNIAALKSQVDMVAFFVSEALSKASAGSDSLEAAFAEVAENRLAFEDLSIRSLSGLEAALGDLSALVRSFGKSIEEIATFVNGLALIRLVGNVESSRSENLRTGFINQLDAMKEFTSRLRAASKKLQDSKDALAESISFVQEAAPVGPSTMNEVFKLVESLSREHSSRAA